MDYLASWMFITSYNSKNSRYTLRHSDSRALARLSPHSPPRSLSFTPPPAPRLPASLPAPPHLDGGYQTLEQLTAQIVEAFDQVRLERDATPQSSPRWHKLTGELLAFARVTALLENMKCGPLSSCNPDD